MAKSPRGFSYNEITLYEREPVFMLTVKKKISEKANKIQLFQLLPSLVCAAAGLAFPISKFGDLSVCALGIAALFSMEKLSYKIIFSAAGLASLGFMCLSDGFYLPYFMAVAVYIACLGLMKKEKLSVLLSVTIFSAAKIILIYNGFVWQYKALALVEIGLMLTLPPVIKVGAQFILNNDEPVMAQDYFYMILTFLLVTLCFSGLDSHWVYPRAAIIMAGAWLYALRGKMSCSMLCLITLLISLLDKTAFVGLFIAFTAVYATGVAMSGKKWWCIYPVCLLEAVAVNLALIQTLSGVALLGTTA